ncbi:MAG TPA: hypothetical protein PL167_14055, partial [Cyclobacteriaceae bacterium]|nr:hypothetical protein [Cyclobacteriaceae bacterium]
MNDFSNFTIPQVEEMMMENDKVVQEEQVKAAAEEVSGSVLTKKNGLHPVEEITEAGDLELDHPEEDYSHFTKADFV